MDRLTISNDNHTLTLPKARELSVTYELESKEYTMASGKLKRDVLGYRKVIQWSSDYFPNDDLTTLLNMITSGQFLNVEYPDPEIGDAYGVFSITAPEPKKFTYVNNNPVWRSIDLEMRSQEVYLSAGI